MDRAILEQKLESLRRCVMRAEDKCPSEEQILREDPDLQDIVSLNLSRAVQLCVDIGTHVIAESDVPAPNTMGETFDALYELKMLDSELALRLKKAVGFRNVAIHNYRAIDWAIVHVICREHLQDFREFARAVTADWQ